MNHSYTHNVGTTNRGAVLTRKSQQDCLIESHLDLVDTLAEKLMKRNSHRCSLTESDLVNAGYEGLAVAAYHYDGERNVSFKTYATKCIWNTMVAEIRKWFPSHTIEVVEIVNGKPVLVKKEEDLFARVDDSKGYPTPLVCCDWEAEETSLYETLDEALDHLGNKERRLIRAKMGYDGKEMRLREIADECGVSTQAIHKRYNHTVSKLRTFFEGANSPYAMCA